MLRQSIAAVFIVSVSAVAAQPTAELDDATVSKILNLQSRNRTPGVAVAMILEGTVKSGPFETAYARRAITVHPVVDGGKTTRRMKAYDFHWTPAYGWFLWETIDDAAGQTVWIWSELRGEVVIR